MTSKSAILDVNEPLLSSNDAAHNIGDEDAGNGTSLHQINRNLYLKYANKAYVYHPIWSKLKDAISFVRSRRFLAMLAIIIFLLYYMSSSSEWVDNEQITVIHHSHVPGMKGYLVWSDKCKIRAVEVYNPETMKFFNRQKYADCSDEKPLTNVKFNQSSGKYVLSLDGSMIDHYTSSGGKLDCCYHAIERSGTGKKSDSSVKLSKCLSIPKSVSLPGTTDNVLVKCHSKSKQTYINAHPMMPQRPNIQKRLTEWKTSNNTAEKPVNVLMLGIDSISRLNLIRAMPKTAQYLYENEWFEMSGYNKMADNTYPNLMAILTGYNESAAFSKCTPTKVGAISKCPFVWQNFRENGYVTAYAEDEAEISTFNYLKVGFEKPPTDYYLRPFLLQAEQSLPIKKKSRLTYCLGYKHEGEYIFDYAYELATRYKNDPYFGLFWSNSFSHNDLSDCSSMDEKIHEYMEKFSDSGVLNNTLVIFFSDHGMRFGPSRAMPTGHYEERLPFMFIWLPPWMKETYPEFVNALIVNKNRLTNPYDIHMTLKHILELSGRLKNKMPKSEGCPNCQTLLKPVPYSRSCDEISIADHWCTCIPYESIYKGSAVGQKLGTAAVDYINDYVSHFNNGSITSMCVKLSLSKIMHVYKALIATNQRNNLTETYRVTFYTKPNSGLFEATLRYTPGSPGEMEVTGQISRLNIYATDSKCISDGGAKKYCSCKKGNGRRNVG